MNFKLFILTGLLSVGFAMTASAGAVVDTDGDLVPDQFDNCSEDDNGPNNTSNQIDANLDGYGNICDADYNNDGTINGGDFGAFVGAFNTLNATVDLNGDGVVNGGDFAGFVGMFNTPVGPSGLACAGTIPCTP